MQEKRQIYLKKKGREEALEIFLSILPDYSHWPEEEVPIKEALGRITSRSVRALLSSPISNVSAMDGVAVRSLETYGASETNPVELKLGPQARFINTGEALPNGFDSVIMIEDIHQPDPETVQIMASVSSLAPCPSHRRGYSNRRTDYSQLPFDSSLSIWERFSRGVDKYPGKEKTQGRNHTHGRRGNKSRAGTGTGAGYRVQFGCAFRTFIPMGGRRP